MGASCSSGAIRVRSLRTKVIASLVSMRVSTAASSPLKPEATKVRATPRSAAWVSADPRQPPVRVVRELVIRRSFEGELLARVQRAQEAPARRGSSFVEVASLRVCRAIDKVSFPLLQETPAVLGLHCGRRTKERGSLFTLDRRCSDWPLSRCFAPHHFRAPVLRVLENATLIVS